MPNEDSLSTKLTDAQLTELLDAYLKEGIPEAAPWINRHRARVQETKASLFNEEFLKSATDEELTRDLTEYYRSVVSVPLYYRSIEENVDKVRAGLLYLLESEDSLQTKVEQVLGENGRYTVFGIAKSFWSTFFQALAPSRNPRWNNKAEQALDNLGMRYWSRGDSPGQVYVAVQRAQLALTALREDLDLFLIDHLMHYVTVMEGKDMIDKWLGQAKPKPPKDDLSKRIEKWREDYLPPERIVMRREAEAEARQLLEDRLGRMSAEEIEYFLKLVNSDLHEGQPRSQRFFPAFAGYNAEPLLENPDLFNYWADRLFTAGPEDVASVLDEFWSKREIPRAGRSVPTLILYLRDPEQFNIDLPTMEAGLEKISDYSRSRHLTGETYLNYNKKAKELRDRYGLEPQELDVVLTVAKYDVREPTRPPALVGFRGFTDETFRFLAELRENNTRAWFHENGEAFKEHVDLPLRQLVTDLGRNVISQLNPDLETEPKSGKTLSRINKNVYGKVEEGLYYPYLWAAFYRRGRTKQTDIQLFVIVYPESFEAGLYFDSSRAREAVDRLRSNVRANEELFREVLASVSGLGDMSFTRDGTTRYDATSATPLSMDDVVELFLDSRSLSILRSLDKDDPLLRSPDLLEELGTLFRELYPIYLFAISDDPPSDLADLIEEPEEEEAYTFAQLTHDLYMGEEPLREMETLLEDKKQLVFYGPPGTGKTYVASKFGQYFAGQGGEVKIIQFHPSYSYEEFMEGIRPEATPVNGHQEISYRVRPGVFRRICDRARTRPNDRFVFIIDEINRGNIPKIFGELLFLLEYRDQSVELPYSKTSFNIPPNVYIIGTMNTADRAIALVDYALRRRFHFFRLDPDPSILELWLEENNPEMLWVVEALRALNEQLERDGIDLDLHIGHSHLMRPELDQAALDLIWQHSILPTVRDYFYDQPGKVERYELENILSSST